MTAYTIYKKWDLKERRKRRKNSKKICHRGK